MAFEEFFPEILKKALESVTQIPTYGERGASRFVYHLLKLDPETRNNILNTLLQASQTLKKCSLCGLISDTDPCRICSSPFRDKKTICVVEESQDAYAIERIEKYKGLYHVLNGRIAPMEGISPQELNIDSLITRIEDLNVREVILATNPNVEGEATANYLLRLLRNKFPKLSITRIAYGAPFGAFLEFLDEVSIDSSLENRKSP